MICLWEEYLLLSMLLDKLRPMQNGRRFTDGTFKRIFLTENVMISIKISLKFVLKSPINNIPALVQIMAWHWPGDKPLSGLMMVSLLPHIGVTRPQWVNKFYQTASQDSLCHSPKILAKTLHTHAHKEQYSMTFDLAPSDNKSMNNLLYLWIFCIPLQYSRVYYPCTCIISMHRYLASCLRISFHFKNSFSNLKPIEFWYPVGCQELVRHTAQCPIVSVFPVAVPLLCNTMGCMNLLDTLAQADAVGPSQVSHRTMRLQ